MTGDEAKEALVALHECGLLSECSVKEYLTFRHTHARYALSLRTPTDRITLVSVDDVHALLRAREGTHDG